MTTAWLASFLQTCSCSPTTRDELVTWTQYLRLQNGKLRFVVKDGVSATWGGFSGLEVEIPSGSTALDDYYPQVSVSNSGVTFGANRVTSFVLLRARKYTAGDVLLETIEGPWEIYATANDPALGTPGDG